jgi:hypothetical protein
MAYQAVIHGAVGLNYYGQVHCTKPNSASGLYSEAKDPAKNKAEFDKCVALNQKFWAAHKPFFQELAKASPIFTLRDAKPEQRVTVVKQDGIELRTKQADKDLFVLAVNASPKARAATFRLPPGSKATELHVLFEARKVPVKDGEFTDQFEPYDTHVYATTAAVPR